VQVFSIANIAEDIGHYPDLALDIINNLSERLREANRRLAGIIPPDADTDAPDGTAA